MKSLEELKSEAKKSFDEDEYFKNLEQKTKDLAWTQFWLGWLESQYWFEYEKQKL